MTSDAAPLDPYKYEGLGDDFVLPDDPDAEECFWADWRAWQRAHPDLS
jgi:hypothetical protein